MRPHFSAARSPALIASIVAVALLLSQAAPGLATNFGAGRAAALAAFEALVPEPGSAAMLGLVAAALVARRRPPV